MKYVALLLANETRSGNLNGLHITEITQRCKQQRNFQCRLHVCHVNSHSYIGATREEGFGRARKGRDGVSDPGRQHIRLYGRLSVSYHCVHSVLIDEYGIGSDFPPYGQYT